MQENTDGVLYFFILFTVKAEVCIPLEEQVEHLVDGGISIGYMHRYKAVRKLRYPIFTEVTRLSTTSSSVLKLDSFRYFGADCFWSFGAASFGFFGKHSFWSFGRDSFRSFGSDSFSTGSVWPWPWLP